MKKDLNTDDIQESYTPIEIKNLISLGRDIIYDFYHLSDTLEKQINFTVKEILKNYERNDLVEVVYSAIKELTINGVKANFKKIIFDEQKINRENTESILTGISSLHEVLENTEKLAIYDKKAHDKKLKVRLTLKHNSKRVIIIVSNSAPMEKEEDKRIREKFEKALNYDSIAEYYMDNMDDAQAEGAGLGITMIVLLLKSSDIDPHAFTVYKNKDNETVAKIEIPLSDDYVSSREIYEKLSN